MKNLLTGLYKIFCSLMILTMFFLGVWFFMFLIGGVDIDWLYRLYCLGMWLIVPSPILTFWKDLNK